MSVEKGNLGNKKEELAKYLSEVFLLLSKTGNKFYEFLDNLILKKFAKKTAEQRWGGIEVFNSSRIRAEQQTRKNRAEQLREAFEDAKLLVVNTGAQKKAEAIAALAQNFGNQHINLNSGRLLLQPSQKAEPMRPRAVDVSSFKAETAKAEFLMKSFPEFIFWLNQLNIALKNNVKEEVVKELLARIVFYGGDINAFVIDPVTGLYTASHKWMRKFPTSLPGSEREKLHKMLQARHITPKGGKTQIIWEAGNTYLNGKKHNVSDLIEVRAKPLPKELLDQYMWAAANNDMERKSNTNFAAFEAMAENGIETISVLPAELAAKGYTLKDFRQSAKPELEAAIQKTIDTNAPLYVP